MNKKAKKVASLPEVVNFVGRPPAYKNAEEMELIIVGYFKQLSNGPIARPPTVTGLGLALGLTRQSLINYSEKNSEFFDTITRAKQCIEAYNEEQLIVGKNPHGVMFNLINNFSGWKAKNETTVSGGTDLAALIAQGRKQANLQDDES